MPIFLSYRTSAHIHSSLMPANLITFAHFSVSAVMKLRHSLGVMGIGVIPRSANRALSLGSARMAFSVTSHQRHTK
jgi:hypothetical protein